METTLNTISDLQQWFLIGFERARERDRGRGICCSLTYAVIG